MPFVRSTPRAEVDTGGVGQRTPRAGIEYHLVFRATGLHRVEMEVGLRIAEGALEEHVHSWCIGL